MPTLDQLITAAQESVRDPHIFLVIAFVLLAFIAAKAPRLVVMMLFVAASLVYVLLIYKHYPERPPITLIRQGFAALHAGEPQVNGCDCNTGRSTVEFVNEAGNTQIKLIHATSGEPVSFGWDADFVCHHQAINGYRNNLEDLTGNMGSITLDGSEVSVLPDIFGKVRLTFKNPTPGDTPHILQFHVAASCVDTKAGNCGFPGHSCPADGTLQILVHRKSRFLDFLATIFGFGSGTP